MLKHFPAVVEFVWRHRYVTGFHVQRAFADKLGNARTRSYQLESLVDLGFLKTAPVRSTSPNFPYVYYASKKGMNLIRRTYREHGITWKATAHEENRPGGITLHAIMHELFLTEFELSVIEAARQREGIECRFTERRYYTKDKRLKYGRGRSQGAIVPDSGILIDQIDPNSSGGVPHAQPILHLVEMDNGTMPISRIREKLHAYDAWQRSPDGESYLRDCATLAKSNGLATWRLLIVCASIVGDDDAIRRRLAHIVLASREVSSALRSRIWIRGMDKMDGEADSLLEQACWLRPRHVFRSLGSKQLAYKGSRLGKDKIDLINNEARVALF